MLSGGPASACTPRARRRLDPALFDLDIPVFGICYGFQAMAQALGGTVARTGHQRIRPHRRPSVTGGTLHSGLPHCSRCG
jgi:GMP synthase (glutamine-hydrolysing)